MCPFVPCMRYLQMWCSCLVRRLTPSLTLWVQVQSPSQLWALALLHLPLSCINSDCRSTLKLDKSYNKWSQNTKFQAFLYLAQSLVWSTVVGHTQDDGFLQSHLTWKEFGDQYQAYETVHVKHPLVVFYCFY